MGDLKDRVPDSSIDKNKGLFISTYQPNWIESNDLLAAGSSFDNFSGRKSVFQSTAITEPVITKMTSEQGLNVSSVKNFLPTLSIVDTAEVTKAQSKVNLPIADGPMAVISTVIDGARNEIVKHPDHLLFNAAAGAAIGVGMVLVGPEAAAVIGVAGLTYGAVQTVKNIPTWFAAAETVANSSAHSQREQKEAKAVLSDFGAGVPNLAAGAVGGSLGGRLAGLAKEAFFQPAVVRNSDFRVRVQEQLRGEHSLAEKNLSTLAKSDSPETWLKSHVNSDEYKLLQYKHYLDKIQIIYRNIERELPALSLDKPASKQLAQAIEQTSRKGRDLGDIEKLVPSDLKVPNLADKIARIQEASFKDPKFEFSGTVAKEIALRILSTDVPLLRFQEGGTTSRFFGNPDTENLKFEISAKQAELLKAKALQSEREQRPMVELLKNDKIGAYGFTNEKGESILGKLSLGIHDAVDHLFVYKELNARGFLSGDGFISRGYRRLFSQMGNSNFRDIFGKESEALASISYETRAFDLTRQAQDYPVKLTNMVESLKLSPTLGKSVNQRAALTELENLILKDPSESSQQSRLLRHVYSAVQNELMERNRQYGHTLLKGKTGFSLLGASEPEYVALILDIVKIADSQKAKSLVRSVNLEIEAALRNPAPDGTVKVNIPFKDVVSDQYKLSAAARDLPSWVTQWLDRYPGYPTRRAPVGRPDAVNSSGMH